MKSLYKTAISVGLTTALAGTLAACGGSGSGDPDRQVRVTPEPVSLINNEFADSDSVANDSGLNGSGIVSDDLVTGAGQSLLLVGRLDDTSGSDLTISNVVFENNGDTFNYQFTVTDVGGTGIDLDSLSIALEVAATGSFADSYSLPLFDIRELSDTNSGNAILLSARSTATDLPTGSYGSRLVVNPNWQHSFDVVPEGGDARPFHYISERNYSNNASDAFRIGVADGHSCIEDGYEDNDSVSAAGVIPLGEQVIASLCLDDVDYYSVVLSADESTSLTFDYTDAKSNPNPATRYIVLDSAFNRITEPTVARESNKIVINAENAGQYYLALFGDRASYKITRTGGAGLQDDDSNEPVFHADSIIGPSSWLFGDVVLNRLALSETMLVEQTVNCGRITTQFNDNMPVAYVTPLHFADIHEFRFLSAGAYLVDGEPGVGWRISDGDITNADWYDNGYPGYAESISDNEWRYWSEDGLAYVECTLEINR